MSILDGLPIAENTDYAKTVWLDDVREALTNPTDEQVVDIDAVWMNDHYPVVDLTTGQIRCKCGATGDRTRHRIRVTLATVVGGDQ